MAIRKIVDDAPFDGINVDIYNGGGDPVSIYTYSFEEDGIFIIQSQYGTDTATAGDRLHSDTAIISFELGFDLSNEVTPGQLYFEKRDTSSHHSTSIQTFTTKPIFIASGTDIEIWGSSNNSNDTVIEGIVNIIDAAATNLTPTGLDNILTTEPDGVASDFREMMVQIWRRFFKKTTKDTGNKKIKTYTDGDAVNTTQDYTIIADVDTIEDAATGDV
jgi:hypothetical protein